MKKTALLFFVLAFTVSAVIFAGGNSGSSSIGNSNGGLRMATGGITGTYYSFGLNLSQILTQKTGIRFSVQATGASKANIQLIDAGLADIAIVQNDVMDYAWHGVELFYGEAITGFLTLGGLYSEPCQIIVLKSSGIKRIEDLRGRNISVGDTGSGTEFNARQILEVYDIAFKDIRKFNLDFAESAAALIAGRIDAFFCIAGTPTIAVSELASAIDIELLEIDDEHSAELIRVHPFYSRYMIPERTYFGQYDPVMTVAVKATLIADRNLPDETAYQLVKNLFDNLHLVDSTHIKGSELSIFNAVEGISIPFHPGALRYYREAGLSPVIPLRPR